MNRMFQWVLGATAVVAVGVVPVRADDAKPAGSEPPAIKWEKRGAASGRALIFLPALGMPGSYWSKVYEPLEKTHPVYIITLAGSDGLPPISAPRLSKTVEAIAGLIESEKLDKPVLIGHLLGAHVALRVAAAYPDRVGGVLGFPLLIDRPPPDKRAEDGKKAGATYLEVDKDMWIPSISVQIKSSVEDAETAAKLIDMIKTCDQKTYGETISELIGDQYEAELAKITAPVMLLAPVSPAARNVDLDKQFERLSGAIQGRMEQIRRLYPNIAKCETAPMRNTRLFPMLDAPDRTVFYIERYLGRLDKPNTQWGTTVGEGTTSAPSVSEQP